MRRIPIAIAVVALALLVALAMTTGTSASRPTARTTTAPVTSTTMVCPAISGTPSGTRSVAPITDVAHALRPPASSSGTVTVTTLGTKKAKPVTIHPAPSTVLRSVAKTSRAVAVNATGSVAASLAADNIVEAATGRYRALLGVQCASPATDWWFSGADGRVGFTDALLMANPAPTAAEVTVSLWGAKGRLQNPRLESLRLPAGATTRVPIASVAPDDATVAVHVHTSSGAVTAALVDHRTSALDSNGGDFIPATDAPSKSLVVAGFAPGTGRRDVVVTAPGSADATVGLRVSTRSGSFTPAGINQVVVRAGHTRIIDLTKAFAGSTGAVSLTSDQPIFANGMSVAPQSGGRPDLMWLAATPPLAGPAAVAGGRQLDGGHTLLYLCAPQRAAQVRINALSGRSATINVPGGRSIAVDITHTVAAAIGPMSFVVTPVGSAPVYGVRVLQLAGAHGALITGEPLLELPTPIVLPPVREDQAVAER